MAMQFGLPFGPAARLLNRLEVKPPLGRVRLLGADAPELGVVSTPFWERLGRLEAADGKLTANLIRSLARPGPIGSRLRWVFRALRQLGERRLRVAPRLVVDPAARRDTLLADLKARGRRAEAGGFHAVRMRRQLPHRRLQLAGRAALHRLGLTKVGAVLGCPFQLVLGGEAFRRRDDAGGGELSHQSWRGRAEAPHLRVHEA
mmetsp:Transcript_65185/g.157241  ORF Transcript_65185/g.157241 Transcript_65185/m.157241 type:complete len:203 (-) Transcript_65185:176-784(-)